MSAAPKWTWVDRYVHELKRLGHEMGKAAAKLEASRGPMLGGRKAEQ